MSTAALPRWRASLAEARRRVLLAVELNLPALTRLKRPESLPIQLDRRRIYVLPTASGVFFGALVAAMLLGALNYNNNPALLLCFVVASAFHTSLLAAYLTLRGMRLHQVQAASVHAGDQLTLRFTFDAGERRARHGLCLRHGDVSQCFAVAAGRPTEVVLDVATTRRGWLAVGRVQIYTRHPLGLFHAWSWMHPDRRVLVYPALEGAAPPLPRAGRAQGARARRGPGEHPHSLRDYRVGDPLRMVAWKRSAQVGHLLVREFEVPAGGDVVLDWAQLGELSQEARIRRLARWVVDAEREGLRSLLRVPGAELGPASGSDHVHACLKTLALLPDGQP